jgi:hypothetical protein
MADGNSVATATAPSNGAGAPPPAMPAARSRVTVVAVNEPGMYYVGKLLGYRDAKPRVVGDTTFRNCDLGLVVGDKVVTVQAPSREAAEAAVDGARVDDLVAIRYETRSGQKDNRAWSFDVLARAGTVDASDFAG